MGGGESSNRLHCNPPDPARASVMTVVGRGGAFAGGGSRGAGWSDRIRRIPTSWQPKQLSQDDRRVPDRERLASGADHEDVWSLLGAQTGNGSSRLALGFGAAERR